MKKTITVFAFAAIFAACSSKKTPDTVVNAPIADTSALYDTSLTDQGKVIDMNGVSDTIVTAHGQYVKVQPDKVVAAEKAEPKTLTTKPIRHRARRSSAGSSTATVYNGDESSTANAPVATEKKKGWSNAAKGAVIGAGTGAVAGAIISKKKGTGAIVGGLLGAGGGYVIGKAKDKKAQKKQ